MGSWVDMGVDMGLKVSMVDGLYCSRQIWFVSRKGSKYPERNGIHRLFWSNLKRSKSFTHTVRSAFSGPTCIS